MTLAIFSFNDSKSMSVWNGFTLDWYHTLFENERLISALYYTLLVAITATIISTIVGTMAAIGIHKMRNKKRKDLLLNINYLPVLNPDIVTGVSLMTLFVFLNVNFGMGTMLLSHLVFDIPYVILSVLPKLAQLPANIEDAALDLGATPSYALRKIILPQLKPGIISGALMAFTMSIDDFVISFFTTGNGVTNLSIEMKCIIPFIVTGIVGLTVPALLGGGHDLIMSLQNLNIHMELLIAYIIIKFIFTFVCFGSGAPGGIFFPLLTLGSLVGDFVGIIMVTYFNIPQEYLLNFIVIAMAGHFAAIVKSPITAIILISEMTGSLNHLLSLAVVSLVALLVSDLLKTRPIYEALLDRMLQNNNSKLEGSYNKKTLVEVSVELGSTMDNNYIKDIKWPEGSLVVSILRGEKEIIPHGKTLLLAGDLVTVMTNENTAPSVLEEITNGATS